MTAKDYWEEEVLFYGKSTPVALLLIEGWAKGDTTVMSALDNYVYATGDDFINTSLMHMRRIYKKPTFRGAPSSSSNLHGYSKTDEDVLIKFKSMSVDQKKSMLTKSIEKLLSETDRAKDPLFGNKQDWIAIYLVVRVRLQIRYTQKMFPEYARSISPQNLPEDLKIGESTIANISHMGLPETPYFEWTEQQMKKNPYAARMYMVCTRFWDIILSIIYENS